MGGKVILNFKINFRSSLAAHRVARNRVKLVSGARENITWRHNDFSVSCMIESERGKEKQRERERETDRDRKWEVRREKQGNEYSDRKRLREEER